MAQGLIQTGARQGSHRLETRAATRTGLGLAALEQGSADAPARVAGVNEKGGDLGGIGQWVQLARIALQLVLHQAVDVVVCSDGCTHHKNGLIYRESFTIPNTAESSRALMLSSPRAAIGVALLHQCDHRIDPGLIPRSRAPFTSSLSMRVADGMA